MAQQKLVIFKARNSQANCNRYIVYNITKKQL